MKLDESILCLAVRVLLKKGPLVCEPPSLDAQLFPAWKLPEPLKLLPAGRSRTGAASNSWKAKILLSEQGNR